MATVGLASPLDSSFHRTRTGVHDAFRWFVVAGALNHRLGRGPSRPCLADCQTYADASGSSRVVAIARATQHNVRQWEAISESRFRPYQPERDDVEVRRPER